MKRFIVIFILLAAGIATSQVQAQAQSPVTATEGISEIKIINHRFTDRVDGYIRGRKSDPSALVVQADQNLIMVVIEAKATILSEKVLLFSEDFVLRYYRDGEETHASCYGIGTKKLMQTRKGTIWRDKDNDEFLLVFTLLAKKHIAETYKIDLMRAGSSDIISYVFSDHKPQLGVLIISNKPSKESEQIVEELKKEGFDVEFSISPKLVGKQNTIVVNHTGPAQPEAKRISSKFEQFKWPIFFDDLRLQTTRDIVIWVKQ